MVNDRRHGVAAALLTVLLACGSNGDDGPLDGSPVTEGGVLDGGGGGDSGPSDDGGSEDPDGGPTNRAPAVVTTDLETREDTPLSATIEIDDDGLGSETPSLVLVTDGSNGTATVDGQVLSYTPAPGFDGSDTVQLAATDGALQGATVDVTIRVLPGSAFHVSPTGDAMNGGLTADDPLPTLGAALELVDEDEDDIVLLAGTYTFTARVELDTGFATTLRGADGTTPEQVVLDFDGTSADLTLEDPGTEVAGVTLRNSAGRCLRITARATVRNAIFEDCAIHGAEVLTAERVRFEDTRFRNNGSTFIGGAARLVDAGAAEFVRCEFDSNVARRGGALLAAGEVSIEDSIFRENRATVNSGGAIFGSSVDLTILDSLFVGNEAPAGGAVWVNDANAFVARSLFVDNESENEAGAIRVNGGTVLTVVSSTLAGNRGGVRAAAVAGSGLDSVRLVFTTVAGNEATATATETIVTLGPFPTFELTYVALDNPSIDDCQSGMTGTATTSFSSDDSCAFIDASRRDIALGLGTLADNGGPTLTALPESTSPLVDAVALSGGNCPRPAFASADLRYRDDDQRGTARPVGAGCDAGAVER